MALLIPQKQILWADEFQANAEANGLLAGYRISVPAESGFAQALVLAFTERNKIEDIEALIQSIPNPSGAKAS